MSSHYLETPKGGVGTVASISIEDLAAGTANPELFLDKYGFCIEQLGFNQQQAIRWADRTVRVDTQVKRAISLRENR